ncbi:MAG: phytoene/squalene synthase family protein [Patescibacteria group bacterium]
MRASPEQQIFKKGSITYYFSSKFFTKKVREDVFKLYSFVRIADDYVDAIPQQTQQFHKLRKLWNQAKLAPPTNHQLPTISSLNERVARNMIDVTRKYDFQTEWIEAFLDAMQADIDKKTYKTLDDTLGYVYGSAEVIGLMMAKIMRLPKESFEAAQMQGRAMQWINFIRDIEEDNALDRQYFPQSDLEKFGIKDLSSKTSRAHPEKFKEFMRFQLSRYYDWQTEAYKGYKFIPRRLRVPLATAADVYNWTARKIDKNPLTVFEQKVKPGSGRVLIRACRQLLAGI